MVQSRGPQSLSECCGSHGAPPNRICSFIGAKRQQVPNRSPCVRAPPASQQDALDAGGRSARNLKEEMTTHQQPCDSSDELL